MSKRELHQIIKENGGYIFSDGTLNLTHLLAKAARFLALYNFKSTPKKHPSFNPHALYNDIVDAFEPTDENDTTTIDKLKKRKTDFWHEQYYGNIELKPDNEQDYSPHHLWDDFESYCQNIAPDGYYFGSSEGDGACIGFFKYEEENEHE